LISKEIASHRRLEHLQNLDSERLKCKVFQNKDLASLGDWPALPVIWCCVSQGFSLNGFYFDITVDWETLLQWRVFSHESLQNIDFKEHAWGLRLVRHAKS
jgi:hypothetical protein